MKLSTAIKNARIIEERINRYVQNKKTISQIYIMVILHLGNLWVNLLSVTNETLNRNQKRQNNRGKN